MEDLYAGLGTVIAGFIVHLAHRKWTKLAPLRKEGLYNGELDEVMKIFREISHRQGVLMTNQEKYAEEQRKIQMRILRRLDTLEDQASSPEP